MAMPGFTFIRMGFLADLENIHRPVAFAFEPLDWWGGEENDFPALATRAMRSTRPLIFSARGRCRERGEMAPLSTW